MLGNKKALTAKAKYALKTLEYLAFADAEVTATEISKANRIPKTFLDTILRDLQRAGIVELNRGRNVGHRLARPSGKITVGEAIRAIDGPASPICCANGTDETCDNCELGKGCSIRAVLIEVCSAISAVIDQISLQEMAAMRPTAARAMKDSVQPHPSSMARKKPRPCSQPGQFVARNRSREARVQSGCSE